MALLAVSELSLRRYFFNRTYSYYATTEVYWEDQHTLLLYLPDPSTLWRLRPGIALKVEEWIHPYGLERTEPVLHHWTLVTNARGYRAPEFQSEKPGRTFRVLCLGDSRTLGEGLDAVETVPGQLGQLLGQNAEVLNLGADGWSAYQGRVLLEEKGIHYDPDAVVACFGINDADRAWGVSDSARVAAANKTFTKTQALLYRSMTFYAGTRLFLKAKSFLFGKTPAGADYGTGPARLSAGAYELEIERMRQICEDRGIRFIYLILPLNRYYPWHLAEDGTILPFDTYNARALDLTATDRLFTIDLRDSRLSQDPQTYFLDDMHLSERGASLVAESLAATLLAAPSAANAAPTPELAPHR